MEDSRLAASVVSEPGKKVGGRVVVVTGGASGLGAAVVRRSVARGDSVAVLDASAARTRALAIDLGACVLPVPTDISDPADTKAAIDLVADHFGRIDAFVGCAGILGAERTVSRAGDPASLQAFSSILAVNLIGMFDAVRLVAAVMAHNESDEGGQRGVVVMTASIAAFEGQVGQVAYSASKAGIAGMTLPLARDLGIHGIRVCTVAPGLMDTAIFTDTPSEALDALAAQPIFPCRLGDPVEFAMLVEHVLDNPYLNGEVLRIDGGLRMSPI